MKYFDSSAFQDCKQCTLLLSPNSDQLSSSNQKDFPNIIYHKLTSA